MLEARRRSTTITIDAGAPPINSTFGVSMSLTAFECRTSYRSGMGAKTAALRWLTFARWRSAAAELASVYSEKIRRSSCQFASRTVSARVSTTGLCVGIAVTGRVQTGYSRAPSRR